MWTDTNSNDGGTYTFMSMRTMTHVCNSYFYGQDVSGSYVYEFPGMRNVSLSSAEEVDYASLLSGNRGDRQYEGAILSIVIFNK